MTGDLHDTATYTFSTDWFTGNIPTWNSVIARIQPARFLEIGSYEGRSACHVLTEAPGPDAISLHCIDPWSLGEGQPADHVGEIEQRFDHNVAVALGRTAKTVEFVKIKEFSTAALPRLLTERGPESYDFIYVDGSHTAPDVLFDAVLAFRLLKVGGVMIFDDYLWTARNPSEGESLQPAEAGGDRRFREHPPAEAGGAGRRAATTSFSVPEGLRLKPGTGRTPDRAADCLPRHLF